MGDDLGKKEGELGWGWEKGDPRCAAIGNLGMGIETPSLRERVNIFTEIS